MTTTQTFEEALNEFREKTNELMEQENLEWVPPPPPYDQSGPPFISPINLSPEFIAKYAHAIGDDNPLYTNPEYGKQTMYGMQIAPGPVLALIRGISAHGAQRPEGYPVANFFSGTAWEFFDVVRPGTSPFRSTKVMKEFFEKQGSRGNLMFLITELYFWNSHGDLPGKAYGTLIMVPIETMGGSRSMSVERLGEHLMYERKASQYNIEQIEELVDQMASLKRRGDNTLYWEDVEVGEKLGPLVLPPWTLQDMTAPRAVGAGLTAMANAFEPAFKWAKQEGEYTRTHPITRWPWTPGAEHEDPVLAAYRGQSGSFDFGVQRTQLTQRLLSDWMGDDGFIRRLQIAIRKPVYYGDATIYTGEVVKKFKESQNGEDGPGAVPGEQEYHAVGIRISGVNQVGETQAPGTACVYLPSREAGPVKLPVPHLARPPYVPYETFYRDWF